MAVKIHTMTYFYVILVLLTGYVYELFYFYICLVIHECGHIVFIKLMGKKIDTLEISPIGGILLIDETQNDHNYKSFLIYLGGPLFSLLLFLWVKNTFSNPLFLQASFVILVLNLIPILPLDGGRLVESLLHNVVWYKLATKVVFIASIIMLAILLFFIRDNYIYSGIIVFFIFKNLEGYKNINYDYHHFRMVKYLYPNPLLNIKVIEKDYYTRLYKGYNNYYYHNNKLISEEKMLKTLLNSNND